MSYADHTYNTEIDCAEIRAYLGVSDVQIESKVYYEDCIVTHVMIEQILIDGPKKHQPQNIIEYYRVNGLEALERLEAAIASHFEQTFDFSEQPDPDYLGDR